jgi:glycosyltransferase involved in cell wall biosynthesis
MKAHKKAPLNASPCAKTSPILIKALTVSSGDQINRRLSLLIISATYVAQENLKKTAALAEHFDVHCVTCRSTVSSLGISLAADLAKTEKFKLHALFSLGQPKSTTKYLLWGLGRIIRDVSADLILVEAEPWAVIRWQAWFWKWWYCPEALFGEFTWENIRRSGWKGWVLDYVYRRSAATSDFIIAGNKEAGELFQRANLPKDRLLVSPQLGVDAALFRPVAAEEKKRLKKEFGMPSEAFVIGFCGRYEKFKGVPELLEAVELLRGRKQEIDIRLILLGHGKLLPWLAAAQQTRPWLHLAAPRPHAEVTPFMQLLDLFVLPSKEHRSFRHLWKEQFGHVLIEAMACGVPVLGSSSGAIPEVIANPELIFPEGDVRAMAERIGRILHEPEWMRQVIRSQEEQVAQRFTNEAISRQWFEFLSERHTARSRGNTVYLGDYQIADFSNRPRRYLEFSEWQKKIGWQGCFGMEAETDEEMEERLSFLRTNRQRIFFSYALSFFNLLSNWRKLRKADLIYCQGPHYFWALALLKRFLPWLFAPRKVVAFFFHSHPFAAKQALLSKASEAYAPFFIVRRQIEELEGEFPELEGRLHYSPWKIDTDWFHPAQNPARSHIVCPGNVQRDEDLVLRLAGRLPLTLVRTGRMPFLETHYRSLENSPGIFRLERNVSHRRYRELLQNAACVILPIRACDEPAGLTAALEAIACGIPIAANDSYGITPLFEGAYGEPPPKMESEEDWIREVERKMSLGGRADWNRSAREYVVANHSILSSREDWRKILDWGSA